MGGSLKGLERVGGRRIIDRVVSAIKQVTPDVSLSANHPEALNWLKGVAILADKTSGFGGISGVHAALSIGRDTLVVAWDMPFVTGDLLDAIVSAGIRSGADRYRSAQKLWHTDELARSNGQRTSQQEIIGVHIGVVERRRVVVLKVQPRREIERVVTFVSRVGIVGMSVDRRRGQERHSQ